MSSNCFYILLLLAVINMNYMVNRLFHYNAF
jgi:hypothetical protein